MMLIVAAVLGAAILVLAFQYWRAAIQGALVILLLEGALRRWVLPGASEMLYFLKDLVLMGAYAGCFGRGRHWPRHVSAALLLPVCGAVLVTLVQLFNPTLNSFVVGLYGLKSYALYIPLAFTLPAVFRTEKELHRFIQWYTLLSVPVCILGVVQFFSPADSVINTYATSANALLGGAEREAETFGDEGNVRITGTFPFLWGYSTYLTVCFPLALVGLVHQRTRFWLVAGVLELVLITGNMFMTGARILLLSTALTVAGFGLFALFERNRNKRIVPAMLVMGAICTLAGAIWFREPVKAFFTRTGDAEDSLVGRTLTPFFVEPWLYMDVAGVGGFGPASTQQASFVLRQQLSLGWPLAFPPPAESEPLRILLELGIPGWALWTVLRLGVVCALFLAMRQLRSALLRQLALTACLIDFLWLLTNAPVFNPTAGVFYWFLAGFALLPQIEQASLKRAAAKKTRTAVRAKTPARPPALAPAPAPAVVPVPGGGKLSQA